MGCCHNWPDDDDDDMRLSWPVSLQLASEFVSKGDEVIFTTHLVTIQSSTSAEKAG